jgi:hypothetical protein
MSEPRTIEEVNNDIQESKGRGRLNLDYVTDLRCPVTENHPSSFAEA